MWVYRSTVHIGPQTSLWLARGLLCIIFAAPFVLFSGKSPDKPVVDGEKVTLVSVAAAPAPPPERAAPKKSVKSVKDERAAAEQPKKVATRPAKEPAVPVVVATHASAQTPAKREAPALRQEVAAAVAVPAPQPAASKPADTDRPLVMSSLAEPADEPQSGGAAIPELGPEPATTDLGASYSLARGHDPEPSDTAQSTPAAADPYSCGQVSGLGSVAACGPRSYAASHAPAYHRYVLRDRYASHERRTYRSHRSYKNYAHGRRYARSVPRAAKRVVRRASRAVRRAFGRLL